MGHKARRADDTSYPPIPDDWGLPGWDSERFERFNDVRRKLHKLMQGFGDFGIHENGVISEN